METGFQGTFVISWSQTEVDGLRAAPVRALDVGTTWSWHGDAVCVDGPNQILRLEQANDYAISRKGAAKFVRRLVKAARSDIGTRDEIEADSPLMDCGFVVTNGTASYTVTLIEAGNGAPPLLMFFNELPPRDTELWVVYQSVEGLQPNAADGAHGSVICFTPGTRIETPDGPRLIEQLREGDYVQTKDSGAEMIQWIGSRRMTGARLFAMPQLRPVRIRAGALGIERPDEELLVSPGHRMLVRGRVAQALFNTPEVLVPARHLINQGTIAVDMAVREITYIHLMLSQHQILWANGVETESFHPAGADMSTLARADLTRLLEFNPSLESEPHAYGGFARRSLNASEAAILTGEAA